MHEEIQFKTSEAGRLLTICPHDQFREVDGRRVPHRVCSEHCRACAHFVSMNNIDGIKCSFIGDMADKAMDARDDAAAGTQGHDV